MLDLLRDFFTPKPTPTPTVIVFSYHWMNLKSRRRGIKTVECESREKFIEKLAEWNRLNPLKWKYWEV